MRVAFGLGLLTLVASGFLEAILPAVAVAQSGPTTGPEVALRLGLALPFGSIEGGAAGGSLNSYASSVVPIVVEGGYRLDADLFVGLRFQYGFSQVKDPNPTFTCGSNISCSGSVVTLGVEGIYRVLTRRTFGAWAGLGVGYEWMNVDHHATGIGFGGTNSGFQGLVQVGGDARVSRTMVLGPFLEVATGRYDRYVNTGYLGAMSGSKEGDITDVTWHTWLTMGVRGALGF